MTIFLKKIDEFRLRETGPNARPWRTTNLSEDLSHD
jgi:hypothetical protein